MNVILQPKIILITNFHFYHPKHIEVLRHVGVFQAFKRKVSIVSIYVFQNIYDKAFFTSREGE